MAATRLAVELLTIIIRPKHATITKTLEGSVNGLWELMISPVHDLERKPKSSSRNSMHGTMFWPSILLGHLLYRSVDDGL